MLVGLFEINRRCVLFIDPPKLAEDRASAAATAAAAGGPSPSGSAPLHTQFSMIEISVRDHAILKFQSLKFEYTVMPH